MSLFVLADPHLSLGTDKPMDVFSGWQDYVDRLRRNWEKLVKPEDTVVLPGDISWAMDLSHCKADFSFLHSLPGVKIIGKGNHDYWWTTMKKMQAFLDENGFDTIKLLFNNAYLAEGVAICGTRGWFFDAQEAEDNSRIIAREAGRLRASIEAGLRLGGTPVVFTHYPVVMDDKACEPLFDVLKEYHIGRCFFGHIHGEKTGRLTDYTVDGVRFSLVSADYLRFCPKIVSI